MVELPVAPVSRACSITAFDQGCSAPKIIDADVSISRAVASSNSLGSTEPASCVKNSASRADWLGEVGEGIDKTIHVRFEIDVTAQEAVVEASE